MRNKSHNATFALCAIVALFATQLGSQSNQPTISITAIPVWGQDGQITGSVFGTGSQQLSLYVFAFLPDLGWAGLPNTCGAVATQSGQFNINASPTLPFRSATRFSAYLVPASLTPNCNSGTATIPFAIQHNAVATVTYPRLPQTSTLSFAGLDWYVKDAATPVYPGPQFFLKDNAFLDSLGQLHMKISSCGGSWCAAEIYTKQTLGYGTYRFTINSQLSNLDRNVTLGLFTWDAQAGDQNNREWDIEFSKWGDPNAVANAQYVVQPYNGPNNIQHFAMPLTIPSVHSVSWSAGQVGFASSTSAGSPISQWNFTGATPVPTPGDGHLHINFYVGAGQAPATPAAQEIVISGFQFVPSAPQVGFSRPSDVIPFQARSYSVPLISTSATCAATIESDSPWLSVSGSNVVLAGLPLQYSVSDNFGSPRSGNLILQSTFCNATLGAQVLFVSQASLVCSPSFALSSTHLGFLGSIFSIAINGTAPSCSWTVQPSSPWLQILNGSSGSGNGTVVVTAAGNADASLRGAALSLNSGATHAVYQDGADTFMAISPTVASTCGTQSAPFGVSWIAAGNVEIHLNSATGPLAGQYGARGSTVLQSIADGTLIFLTRAAGASGPSVIASARAAVASSNCSTSSVSPLGIVNAASYSSNALAPGSLATVFGANLSQTTTQATGAAYPPTLGGVTVSIGGQVCPLGYVSPSQVNFAVPANLAPGRYTMTVGSATSEVLVASVAPGVFTLKGDGTGVPLAAVSGVVDDGSTVSLPPYQCSATGCGVVPIVLPPNLTDLYIVLYGTGIRGFHSISALLGTSKADVDYAGAQGSYIGLDQINLHLKGPLSLTGTQVLTLQVDGVAANNVSFQFQ